MRVLVDTSVWIDFFNPHISDSLELRKLKTLINSEDGGVVLCPIIYQEILQGIRDDRYFEEIKRLLSYFPMLKKDFPIIEDVAVDLYRSLRKKGITIRKSNDCLIAAYSFVFDVPVLFHDRDFDAICNNTSVRKF
ncbi:MAG: PIN domain-containing protein [Treponema sp.]|nr:PIN domain-containing protein [Treponema sp.]